MRPLPTQFKATPPASTRFLHARLLVDVPGHPQHDFLGHRLDRGGQIHVALCYLRLRLCGGGPPKSVSNFREVIVRPWQ